MRKAILLLVSLAFLAGTVPAPAAGGDWFDALQNMREEARKDQPSDGTEPTPLPRFGEDKYTFAAWIKTMEQGTIFSKASLKGSWKKGGKTLFVRDGRVCFDIGFVGCVSGKTPVADGEWHHVALTGGRPQSIYIDGRLDVSGNLDTTDDLKKDVFKLGSTSSNFPGNDRSAREIDDARVYGRVLAPSEIKALAQADAPASGEGLLAYWPFDKNIEDASGSLNHPASNGKTPLVAGKFGKALQIKDGAFLAVSTGAESPEDELWRKLSAEFNDPLSVDQMEWEREDGIWGADWNRVSAPDAARRYARATRRPAEIAKTIQTLAAETKTPADLKKVRALYIESRRYGQLLEQVAEFQLTEMRATIENLYDGSPQGVKMLAQLDAIETEAIGWAEGSAPAGSAFDAWKEKVAGLRRDAVVLNNPLLDFDELLFVKRMMYDSNHYYTEYINGNWEPGGNLCALSLKTGKVRELVPELKGGVFERFDLSFDAKRVVFAWKCDAQEGYRIYEVNVDGTGLRQLTFPPKDEKEIQKSYRVFDHYHHGTDDMQPCYLPDGGILFISTRCQYGILCDAPDDFTTTILYRMDPDGKNMKKLTNSSVSEASPAMLPDGRIMYTRWEYVDKGAVSVKCLWAMRPDGSGSSEIYANDISLPPTFMYGRAIPGAPNKYVVMGVPHCPQNGVGTVIRLDTTRPIRTRDPMTYMTPDVDIRAEGGFSFRDNVDSPWKSDGQGQGRLFKDPFPLSEQYFLVAHKPAGPVWHDATNWDLYLLDEKGNTQPIYRDTEISCFLPFPLRPRQAPPELSSPINPQLAAENLAECVVTDIYHGMENVERGTIKHIRVLEQVPRPWASRRRWGGDQYDQQHVVITKDTHLGLKAQHGVVPVEEDGSARFIVPANKNIFLQALDENYMAVQTERTYVNYIPGETRGCIGCHETPDDVVPTRRVLMALSRPASVPGPQPGEKQGGRPIDYATDVQPVLDKHCVECHEGDKPEGGLDLTGTMTALFNVSYEKLIPERRDGQGRRSFDLVGPTIGENHPKTGNVHYMPARSFGSHSSVLVAMLSKGKVQLEDAAQAERATKLAKEHKKINLKPEEMIRLTNWVDTNGQYYGSWWGRRNLRYKDHPNFRPTPSIETAVSMTSPIPEEER